MKYYVTYPSDSLGRVVVIPQGFLTREHAEREARRIRNVGHGNPNADPGMKSARVIAAKSARAIERGEVR